MCTKNSNIAKVIYDDNETKRLVGGIKIEENKAEANPGAESKGSTGGLLKTLVLVVIVAGISAFAAYQAGGISLQGALEEKEQEISHKDSTILDQKDTISQLESQLKAKPTNGGDVGALLCSTCHDTDQTKGFHSVGDIKLLSEAKGQTPRICTTCHGSQPHNVHGKKLSSGEMDCNTCHVSPEGDYVVPSVPEGKTLVCEACHAFSGKPEDVGNYVAIHIVEGNRECDICHMGDAVKIHKRATEKLGVVE